MYEKAVEKITNEMNANENKPYVQVVGKYLLDHLANKHDHAEKLCAEEKTILKSLSVMRRYAESKRVENVAVLTDEEGFAVVLQYFGCWEGEPIEIPPEPERRPIPTTTTVKQATSPRASVAANTRNKKGENISPQLTQLSLF